jgi:predicted Zn-dependent protease
VPSELGRAEARRLRAEIRFRLGRYHGARIDAEAAVAAEPSDVASWAILIRSVARSGGASAGIEAAKRGVEAAGRHPALLLPWAASLAEHARVEEAFRLLEDIELGARLRENPVNEDDAVAGMIREGLGPAPVPADRIRAEFHSVGTTAARAREHWPGRLAQMRGALEVHLRQQKWTEAQRLVELARRTYPDTPFAPFVAGIFELARGKAEEAEKHLSESLEAAPRSPVVTVALAKAWSRQKGAAFAAERLMRLAERDTGFAFARYMAARAYLDGRDPLKAEGALRRGLELQPDSPVSYQYLAEYLMEVDRGADAMSILQQAVDRFPGDVSLQLGLAELSAGLGRARDAIRIYENVSSRRPDLDIVLYKLAALLASQADEPTSERLRQLLQHLHADEPSDPTLLHSLGWAHHHAGDPARARVLITAAVNGDPDEPRFHFHLALVYAAQNEVDLARSELEAAVRSKRPFPERLDALRLLRERSSAPTPGETATAASPQH